ncbi:MAG: preprotein translocase subunit SecE [Parachlamydiaceae bacterium]
MAVDVNMIDVKKTQVQQLPKTVSAPTSETVARAEQWKNFIGSIKDEFKKISWTNPEELRLYTKLVVAMTFVCGMGIYFLDIIIQAVLSGLNVFMRLIGG